MLLTACWGGSDAKGWTVEEAESVTRIRGLHVRVLRCTGLGSETDSHYQRFACRAGTRAAGEPFDTVTVLYELRVVDDSRYELRHVRFIGGTGIP